MMVNKHVAWWNKAAIYLELSVWATGKRCEERKGEGEYVHATHIHVIRRGVVSNDGERAFRTLNHHLIKDS